jgi:glutamine---fructose-6-phosphate transaminase (isomerizing)
MCGIIGYVGHRAAVPILIEGLKRLEYRGYDSAGLSVLVDGALETRKSAGKITALEAVLRDGGDPAGTCGIAHTRWATHGAPTTLNAHPHVDCAGDFALVHNGIIENSGTLRQKLEALGHTLRTETDTEVVAHMIEEV